MDGESAKGAVRIHYLQHVPFEGPAHIEHWAATNGHALASSRLHCDDPLPDPDDVDLLAVLGGPMGVHDEDAHPWLGREKAFIRDVIDAGTPVVGICLGAQLIADVLGARVYRGEHKEIGWFPIELTPETRRAGPFADLPNRLTVFHWHGDTFDLPAGAVRLARSDACENQAFLYGDRVLGLQFHLESTPESVRLLVENGDDDLVPDRYVQGAEQILAADDQMYATINAAMAGLLEWLKEV